MLPAIRLVIRREYRQAHGSHVICPQRLSEEHFMFIHEFILFLVIGRAQNA